MPPTPLLIFRLGVVHEDLAAKPAADVVQFLVSTTGLAEGFGRAVAAVR